MFDMVAGYIDILQDRQEDFKTFATSMSNDVWLHD